MRSRSSGSVILEVKMQFPQRQRPAAPQPPTRKWGPPGDPFFDHFLVRKLYLHTMTSGSAPGALSCRLWGSIGEPKVPDDATKGAQSCPKASKKRPFPGPPLKTCNCELDTLFTVFRPHFVLPNMDLSWLFLVSPRTAGL